MLSFECKKQWLLAYSNLGYKSIPALLHWGRLYQVIYAPAHTPLLLHQQFSQSIKSVLDEPQIGRYDLGRSRHIRPEPELLVVGVGRV